ncbi:MAG: hypothetical protein IKS61_00895 [Aeriscardovia sp.]|nr:hypothetical protein [Aeriscardovia sp.]
MLHRFSPIGCFRHPSIKRRPGGFTPFVGNFTGALSSMYMWEEWCRYYGIPEKWPRGGTFSKKYWQVANEVVALHKAEKEPIPPEPKEN